MMRRGPDGPRTLCNACGLFWSNKVGTGILLHIVKDICLLCCANEYPTIEDLNLFFYIISVLLSQYSEGLKRCSDISVMF